MTKYRMEWSVEQVLLFYGSHTCATDLLAHVAGISTGRVLRVMACALADEKQLRWSALKRLVKSFHGKDFSDYKRISVEMRRRYLTYMKWCSEEQELDELIAKNALDFQAN